MANEIEKPLEIWTGCKTWPDQIRNDTQNSVDVLCYIEHTNEHTIGWFNFNTMQWVFLCREPLKAFIWRYFNPLTEKPIK